MPWPDFQHSSVFVPVSPHRISQVHSRSEDIIPGPVPVFTQCRKIVYYNITTFLHGSNGKCSIVLIAFVSDVKTMIPVILSG